MAFQEKNREQSLESSAPRVLRSGEPKEVTRSTPSIKEVLPNAEPGQSHEYNIGTRGRMRRPTRVHYCSLGLGFSVKKY